MIKNKSLFKNLSIFLCLVPMLLLSLFCLVPSNNFNGVYAYDEIITNYNFVGSNIIVASTMENLNNNTYDRQSIINVTLTFGVEDGVYRCAVSGYADVNNFASTLSLSGVATYIHNIEDGVARDDILYVRNQSNTGYGYRFRVWRSGNISSDIIKVEYSHYNNLTPNIMKPANYYNTITYFDSNNNMLCFEIPLFTNGQTFASRYLFEERTYYFTSSFDDNDFYNLGYQDGLDTGLQDGYNNGYQDGLDTGTQSGYQDGYSAGVESANDYSFIGLLGAVIDAPVTAFTGLLNFEILGFNILAFVTGLITLALIIFIIKLCIGGK